jgi:excinuclease ABC subunit B
MGTFEIKAPFEPAGDQPAAIAGLAAGLRQGKRHQVLLGVTGSGKTYTIAKVIEEVQRPALVIAHNKTLAAQLYREFKELFPSSAVEYFVSYYDYFQPEAYIPVTDTYIAKESNINDEIDRLRHAATRAVMERRDVIIVASVSCIFAMGNPETYRDTTLTIEEGSTSSIEALSRALVRMQYKREQYDFERGCFRVRGDTLEVFPASEVQRVLRISFFGDTVERIDEADPVTGRKLSGLDRAVVFANTHYVTPRDVLQRAMDAIRAELAQRKEELLKAGKPHLAERLDERTLYDLELLEVSGFCPGVENYSRFLDGRKRGEPPWTLLSYFPNDFVCIVDESHVTIPQLAGMYHGDRVRKENLVEYGFRLPSALDNRPLTFDEWRDRVGQVIYVSATPGDWEVEQAGGRVQELVVRPTGLLDPAMEVRPAANQVENLLPEVRARVEKKQRVLVATLTKRMAEDLTEFLRENGINAAYLHSDIDTLERVELLYSLRQGRHDVLVGINLLREGLDLPEVGLVAVLDADKEGFLRAYRSLVQVSGRAARNADGTVILYADRETDSIRQALAECARRRALQDAHNRKHGITPTTIQKPLLAMPRLGDARAAGPDASGGWKQEVIEAEIAALRREMRDAAKRLEFEKAAELRDKIASLTQMLVES